MASHPTPCNKPPEHGRAVRTTQETSQNLREILNHLHMHQGSRLLPIFRALSRSLHLHPYTIIPLLPKATFTPSKHHNISLPRTRFRHQHSSTHKQFSPRVQTISIISDPLYSVHFRFYSSSSTHLFTTWNSSFLKQYMNKKGINIFSTCIVNTFLEQYNVQTVFLFVCKLKFYVT